MNMGHLDTLLYTDGYSVKVFKVACHICAATEKHLVQVQPGLD